MIQLYPYEAWKEMLDRAGEPAELKVAKASAVHPEQHGLAPVLGKIGQWIRSQTARPSTPRPESARPQTVSGAAARS
jgi:hypothetical protein